MSPDETWRDIEEHREDLPERRPQRGYDIPPPPMHEQAEKGWRVGKSFVAGLVLGTVLGAGLTVLIIGFVVAVGVAL